MEFSEDLVLEQQLKMVMKEIKEMKEKKKKKRGMIEGAQRKGQSSPTGKGRQARGMG